mmetsp:Transcript_56433/g.178564  ORF Transcript_56433/g.178564 Transcript_56433/m.178564 type:complete len:260 (-) Transcript_56433:252-1031(-)
MRWSPTAHAEKLDRGGSTRPPTLNFLQFMLLRVTSRCATFFHPTLSAGGMRKATCCSPQVLAATVYQRLSFLAMSRIVRHDMEAAARLRGSSRDRQYDSTSGFSCRMSPTGVDVLFRSRSTASRAGGARASTAFSGGGGARSARSGEGLGGRGPRRTLAGRNRCSPRYRVTTCGLRGSPKMGWRCSELIRGVPSLWKFTTSPSNSLNCSIAFLIARTCLWSTRACRSVAYAPRYWRNRQFLPSSSEARYPVMYSKMRFT